MIKNFFYAIIFTLVTINFASAKFDIKASTAILQDYASGEILFEKLKSAHKILLDCKNKEILILEYTKYDNEVEARKILKSLGYIK